MDRARTIGLVIAAALIAAMAIAVVVLRSELIEARTDADAARTETERAREDLDSCERTVEALRMAGDAERKTREITEARKNAITQQMETIRADSCHIDDGGGTLDARLRDLAVEAYRVAVCTATGGDVVQTAGGAAP